MDTLKVVKVEDLKSGDVVVNKNGRFPAIVSGYPQRREIEDDVYIMVDYKDPDRRRQTYNMRGFEEGLWTSTYDLGEEVFIQDKSQ